MRDGGEEWKKRREGAALRGCGASGKAALHEAARRERERKSERGRRMGFCRPRKQDPKLGIGAPAGTGLPSPALGAFG